MDPITGTATASLSALSIAPVTPASALLGAAEALLTGIQPLAALLPDSAWPLTFLSGQIVECALKSYLMQQGVPEAELKHHKVRHNLAELWSRSETAGLAVPHPIWLARLSELHAGPYILRYPMGIHGVVLPQCAEMATDLQALLRTVREGNLEVSKADAER